MLAKTLLAATAALTFALSAPAHATKTTVNFTSLTVFGDSLVDAGNIFAATGGAAPSSAQGYFQGRFTNGYNYNDLLSIDLFGTPTRASLTGGTNYAFGGARIIDTGDTTPDLVAQLSAWTARIGSASADANGLYIVNLGGNDIFGALSGNIGSFSDTDSYLRAAAAQYASGVAALDARGARNILITGFPNPGTPFTAQAEIYLTSELARLSLNANTTLMRYDYLDFFGRVTSNPGAFGLPALNLTTTCIQANAQASGCAGYFSFDGTHPTAAIQRAAYQDMNRQFGLFAVPEPATWTMLIAGFAMIGGVLRRRPAARFRGQPALA
jgi:outer membrane lipase/esterase